MNLQRPFRFFAPTLAVVLAAVAGVTACGSIVDVANSTTTTDASVPSDGSPDGGLIPDAQADAATADSSPTTDAAISAASWEVRFLPWDNQGSFDFEVFDQTVVAKARSFAGDAPSYVIDLTTRGSALSRVSLYDGTPIAGTFRAASPRGKIVAFAGTAGMALYDVGAGGATNPRAGRFARPEHLPVLRRGRWQLGGALAGGKHRPL